MIVMPRSDSSELMPEVQGRPRKNRSGGWLGRSAPGRIACHHCKVKTLHGKGGHEDFSSEVQAAVVMSGPMEISTGSVAERSLTAKNPVANAIFLFGGTVKEKPGLYKLADAHLHIDDGIRPPFFFNSAEPRIRPKCNHRSIN